MSDGAKQATRTKAGMKALLVRPVAFHPVLARICGSVTAGLMLSQALYWSERTTDDSGWFYKTADEWTEEICLSRTEQATARKALVERGFLQEEKRGMPGKMHFSVDTDRVCDAIASFQETCKQVLRKPENKFSGNLQTGVREPCKQVFRKAANLSAGNLKTPPLIAETTTESTAETTSSTTDDDVRVVTLAMSRYGITDRSAVMSLMGQCRTLVADASAEEIAYFVHEKGPLTYGPKIRNPVGLLLKAVPQCFEGPALEAVRDEIARQKRSRLITCQWCGWEYETDGERACPSCRAAPDNYAAQSGMGRQASEEPARKRARA